MDTDIEDNRKAVSESVKAGYELLPSENQSLIHKLAFLTIIKSSNKIHRPKKGSIVNGISILKTRYTTSAMQQVYGSTVVPIVSSNDKLFLKRHFFYAHTYARSDSNLRVHTDLSLTLSKAKYVVISVTSDWLRIIYRTFLKSCTGCRLQRSKVGGEYKLQLGNPRLIDLLGVENPLYHTVQRWKKGWKTGRSLPESF